MGSEVSISATEVLGSGVSCSSSVPRAVLQEDEPGSSMEAGVDAGRKQWQMPSSKMTERLVRDET